MRRFLTSALMAVVLGGMSPALVLAQATGTISGIETDGETGAAIPGVTIEATNTATNQTRAVVTGEDGFYTVPLLKPGPYVVKATLAGFRTTTREAVTVTVESTSRIDFRMGVGQIAETVTVSGAAPPAGLGGGSGDATPGGFGAATSGFNVNGMRNQSNNFLLDGASNNDTFNTGFIMRPPPDAIQEFKILRTRSTPNTGGTRGRW